MNIKQVLNMDVCCGCTACYSICPNHSITMKIRFDGFYYPDINTERCIDCGLCYRVCPMISVPQNDNTPECYIMRNKNLHTLKESTSGGMFTPLAEFIISQGGVAYGVKFDEKFNVVHGQSACLEEIEQFRGSKYVQSNLGESFHSVKEHLEKGQKVLFSGTPCQVAGLKKFLNKEYVNLYCVDLVCRGGASPMVFHKYLEYLESKYHSKVKSVKFRKKVYGYHSSAMQIEFENNKKYIASGRTDYMLISFFSGLCSRKSCYQCRFRTAKRVSDLTLFDGWHYTQLTKGKKDDDKGYTIVLIQSEKGKQLINCISENVRIEKINLNEAIEYDGIMLRSQPICNKDREIFINILSKESLEIAIKKTVGVTLLSRIIEKNRVILYYLGILRLFKRSKLSKRSR